MLRSFQDLLPDMTLHS